MLLVEICKDKTAADARKIALQTELGDIIKGTRMLDGAEQQDLVVAHFVPDGTQDPVENNIVFNGDQHGVKDPAVILLVWT